MATTSCLSASVWLHGACPARSWVCRPSAFVSSASMRRTHNGRKIDLGTVPWMDDIRFPEQHTDTDWTLTLAFYHNSRLQIESDRTFQHSVHRNRQRPCYRIRTSDQVRIELCNRSKGRPLSIGTSSVGFMKTVSHRFHRFLFNMQHGSLSLKFAPPRNQSSIFQDGAYSDTRGELKGELHPSGFWLFDLLNGSCRNGPEEMKDIKIQLCRVPDIITPGFFSSILDARDGDKPALDLFQSLPVRAAVSFTFWKGAVWMDLLQFIFSLWGLILLFIVTWHAQETEYCPEGQANNNATALFNSTREQNLAAEECRRELASVFASSLVIDISGEEQRHERAVVADWIIAKGIVDLLLEGLQFAGCVATNQTRCYFRFGNLWDIIRSILPILLLPYYSCRLLQILVVLMYWMRLLEGATLTQKIGHALLPLQNLIRGLFPAMLFTIIGFGALTHALYAVHNQNEKGQFQRLWPGAVWTTFTRLIVGELDDDPLKDNMELLVLLFGVLFFSVFMMNVFIGVINDQYSEEMKTVRLSFQSLRTKSCLTHLLRMSVIPCDWLRAVPAAGVSVVCVIVCLALQILALVGKGFQAPGCWQFFIFLFLQFVTFMASFQCKGCDFPWLTFLRGNSKTRYLWICEPRDYGEMDADDNEVKPNTTCAEPACISMTRVQTNGGDGRATYPGTYPPTYTSSSAPLASAPLASAPLALPPNPTLLTPCRRRPADVIVCSPKEHAEKCCGLWRRCSYFLTQFSRGSWCLTVDSRRPIGHLCIG